MYHLLQHFQALQFVHRLHFRKILKSTYNVSLNVTNWTVFQAARCVWRGSCSFCSGTEHTGGRITLRWRTSVAKSDRQLNHYEILKTLIFILRFGGGFCCVWLNDWFFFSKNSMNFRLKFNRGERRAVFLRSLSADSSNKDMFFRYQAAAMTEVCHEYFWSWKAAAITTRKR